MNFHNTALLLTFIWFLIVVVRFRRSSVVILGGLGVVGLYAFAALALGWVRPSELGLGIPGSWLATLGFALAGLGVMLAYSPLADWLAARWFKKPPSLAAFGAIQQSRANLIAGIVAAWLLGGVLEELIARGIVLTSVETFLVPWVGGQAAVGAAVCIAAAGAGVVHFYQGPRAVLIISQLSLLLGVLFVVSGYNLWAVMLCHGLYDTIAFIRFANKQSKYSHLDQISG